MSASFAKVAGRRASRSNGSPARRPRAATWTAAIRARRKRRHRGVRRRPAVWDHAHDPAQAAAALGDRGDDRPHEARRQTRAQPPQGHRWRRYPCAALRRRPQPAPDPAPTWPGFFAPCSACSLRSLRRATSPSKRRKIDFFRADQLWTKELREAEGELDAARTRTRRRPPRPQLAGHRRHDGPPALIARLRAHCRAVR
jgi:hypothetical protein